MSEFEDKLNSILSSPEDMEKIMNMARSLSGSLGSGETAESAPLGDVSGLLGGLGNLDPKLIGLLGRILGEYSSDRNDKSALLSAIKPYLREERRDKIDRAAEIARLARIARIALSEFSGGDSIV